MHWSSWIYTVLCNLCFCHLWRLVFSVIYLDNEFCFTPPQTSTDVETNTIKEGGGSGGWSLQQINRVFTSGITWRSLILIPSKQLKALLPRRCILSFFCSFRQYQMSITSPKAVKRGKGRSVLYKSSSVVCVVPERGGIFLSFQVQAQLYSLKQCRQCLFGVWFGGGFFLMLRAL